MTILASSYERKVSKSDVDLLIKLMLLSALLAMLFYPKWGHAQNTVTSIKIASEEWEGNTNADGTGSYFETIRKVYALSNIEMSFEIVPYERSVEMAKSNAVDAWVASYDEEEDFALFPQWHFDADTVTAIFKKERYPKFNGVDSLTGQVVSWIRGYAYDDYIEVDMQIFRHNKRTSALEMLVRDRVDFILDAEEEIQSMIGDEDFNKEINFRLDSYALAEILQLNLYLGFSDTPKSKQLIEIWDTNFPLLLESGEIRKIFDKYDVEGFPF